jgi:hypothetical protein
MLLIVKKLLDKKKDSFLILFETTIGAAQAHWMGHKPEINKEYNVEIDIKDVLEWDMSISKSNFTKDLIYQEEGYFCMNTELNSIDENNIVALKINGSFVFVETVNVPKNAPSRVVIKAKNVNIFDINL